MFYALDSSLKSKICKKRYSPLHDISYDFIYKNNIIFFNLSFFKIPNIKA